MDEWITYIISMDSYSKNDLRLEIIIFERR
jgi:hypothetical protein